MGRVAQFVDEVISRLRERGYDGEKFRGADEVEVYRTDQYLRWTGRAQAWMGRGEEDFVGLVKQYSDPTPSEGTASVLAMARDESAAFERDLAYFRDHVRTNPEYANKYVAVHDGTFLDSAASADALVSCILARPNGSMLLRKALIERVGETSDSALGVGVKWPRDTL